MTPFAQLGEMEKYAGAKAFLNPVQRSGKVWSHRRPGINVVSGGARAKLIPTDIGYQIENLHTAEAERGKGLAGIVMDTITRHADRRNKAITLWAPTQFPGSERTLQSWYATKGFKSTGDGWMKRLPGVSQNLATKS